MSRRWAELTAAVGVCPCGGRGFGVLLVFDEVNVEHKHDPESEASDSLSRTPAAAEEEGHWNKSSTVNSNLVSKDSRKERLIVFDDASI